MSGGSKLSPEASVPGHGSAGEPRIVANRYRLMESLGHGGMGRVWRAYDEVLHRHVALKEILSPRGLTARERDELQKRSIREARAIARLDHPNIVRVFDVISADGEPWIVMEYVPSTSLDQVLSEDGPVTPERAARIGLEILRALQAIHQCGALHRDVKPANVLLAGNERIVLTDFGLATLPDHPTVTQAGLVLGSPSYIAPERALDGAATPEGDLWSLGATLYKAVEGRAPYARRSVTATLAALASEPLEPPTQAGRLEPVIMGFLRKDPAARIKPAEAERLLLSVLGEHDAGQPCTSKPRTAEPVVPAPEAPGAQGQPPRVPTGTAVPERTHRRPTRRAVTVVTSVVVAIAFGALLWLSTDLHDSFRHLGPGDQANAGGGGLSLPKATMSPTKPGGTLQPSALAQLTAASAGQLPAPAPPGQALPPNGAGTPPNSGAAGNPRVDGSPPHPIEGTATTAPEMAVAPSVVNDASGLCLGIDNASELSGARAIVENCRGARTQAWRIRNTIVLSGHEYAQFQNDAGLCLVVAGASASTGAAVVQGECSGPSDHSQFWYAAGDSNQRGVSRWQNGHSGLFMDVAGSSADGGAEVVQKGSSNSLTQYWRKG